MVLHITAEKDMRFLTSKRKQLVDALKVLYLQNAKSEKRNLPIYGVKASNLLNYEKSDVDLKKGILSKEPND